MNLDFSNNKYFESAVKTESVNYENGINSADAFILLLKDLDYETINNLCEYISDKYAINNPKMIYSFIQSDNIDSDFKKMVLSCAYDIIHSNKNLGTKEVNGFNSSSWISHSLYEGEVASNLAREMNLDPDTAMKIGLLHDIGRKFDHSFMHTIKGYEYLYDLGFKDEAICCLSHSFLPVPLCGELKGNRCANCDPALDGFYIDKNGNGVFESDSDKDQMTHFLENYNYNSYDMILNISDLMATANGIVSPYDRMNDVYTRKSPDYRNSPFFKVCFINALRKILFLITNDSKYESEYNIRSMNSIQEIESLLIETSNDFIEKYNDLSKEKSDDYEVR